MYICIENKCINKRFKKHRMKAVKEKYLIVRMPENLKIDFFKICNDLNRKPSKVIRDMIENRLQRHSRAANSTKGHGDGIITVHNLNDINLSDI
jgi:hypothetical protein